MQKREVVEECMFALFLIGIASAVWLNANSMPPPLFDPVGSAIVPQVTATIIILLALIILVRLVQKAMPTIANEDTVSDVAYGVAAACLSLMVIYALALQYLPMGFAVTTALYIFGTGALLRRKGRWISQLAFFAASIGIGLSVLFTDIFYIHLP